MPDAVQQNLQAVKFIIDTTATILSLDLDMGNGFVPLTVNNGRAQKNLPSGNQGIAVLRIGGAVGSTAKFKIVQVIGGVDVVLTERNFIKITSAKGQTVANVNFIVR